MGQTLTSKPKPVKSPRQITKSLGNSDTETTSTQETPRQMNNNNKKRLPKKSSQQIENFSQKKLEKLFDKYKDSESDKIMPTGAMQFLKDLELMPTNVEVLVIAWHLNARQMGIFTKEEFIGGFKQLGLDSIDKIKLKLQSFREELTNQETLKKIYRFSFDFYKEEREKKTIDLELVDSILEILVPEKPHIAQFRKYLKKQKKL